jgi:hypothetical protein
VHILTDTAAILSIVGLAFTGWRALVGIERVEARDVHPTAVPSPALRLLPSVVEPEPVLAG